MDPVMMEKVQQMMASLPPCAQPAIMSSAQSSDCGLNFVCLCTSEKFLTSLQEQLSKACDLKAQAAVMKASGSLCLEAVPALRESRQEEILGVVITLMIITTVAVVLRFVARRMTAAKYGVDDLLTVLALVFTFGLNIACLISVRNGFGLHMMRLDFSDLARFGKLDFTFQLLFGLAVTSIKLSILFFYHRIFTMRTFTRISMAIGTTLVLWCLAHVITVIFSCRPIAFAWDKTIQGGKCINQNNFSYGTSAANFLTDIAVLILPIPWLVKLQMQPGKKVAVAGIFLLGSFACIAGIVRIPLLTEMKSFDISYTVVNPAIWINVECNIGIVSACLPVMRPLFKMAPSFPKSIVSRFTGSRRGHYFTGRSSKLSKLQSASESGGSKSGGGRYADVEAGSNGKSLPLGPYAAEIAFQTRSAERSSVYSNETEVRVEETFRPGEEQRSGHRSEDRTM